MDEITTLDELIQKKEKLITVVGVFGAIVAFSIDLNYYPITFSALGIFLLLSWELYKNIPSDDKNNAQKTFMSSLKMVELLFFGFVLGVYFYVGTYAFVLQPETRNLFILFFIAVPVTNFFWLFMSDWINGPEITNLKLNKCGFRLWFISMVILLPILWVEICYILIKIFEHAKLA
jgi:uncharacterized membrane protein YhdT